MGFKPETMTNKILPALGYNGPSDQKSINAFLAASPAAAAKMGKYTMAARQMVEGKPVGAFKGFFSGIANDLKMATAAKGLRILAPIPGKSAVGIEVPDITRETVYIKQVIKTRKFVETDMALPVAFGKTIENEVFMMDLAKMPHLLVAGATGSGKSVGINTIITCL